MERNQNVQQNAQGQQTVQDVFVKEKIMPHCTKIDELSVRCDDRFRSSRWRKILELVVTGIFESSSPFGKPWRTRGCTHLRPFARALFFFLPPSLSLLRILLFTLSSPLTLAFSLFLYYLTEPWD